MLCFFIKIIGFLTLRNVIRVSNSSGPDQARQNVGPDLDPNCLQMYSTDDTSREGKALNRLCFLSLQRQIVIFRAEGATEIRRLQARNRLGTVKG